MKEIVVEDQAVASDQNVGSYNHSQEEDVITRSAAGKEATSGRNS